MRSIFLVWTSLAIRRDTAGVEHLGWARAVRGRYCPRSATGRMKSCSSVMSCMSLWLSYPCRSVHRVLLQGLREPFMMEFTNVHFLSNGCRRHMQTKAMICHIEVSIFVTFPSRHYNLPHAGLQRRKVGA